MSRPRVVRGKFPRLALWTLVATGLLVACSPGARAHPVSFVGSTVVWTSNQPQQSRLHLNFTSQPWLAFGMTYDRIDQPEGTANIAYPQVNVLAQRWNLSEAQANIYFTGGLGYGDFRNRTRLAGEVSLTLDYETRSEFVMLMAERVHLLESRDFDHVMLKTGLAPYLADYGELQNWLMLEIDWRPYQEEPWMVTPLFRFFYRNVLWELGSSLRGDWMLNLMVHF